jgi:hypothetical protein
MKEYLIKLICFITGADWRLFFPERWDLSDMFFWKEYGSSEDFIRFYKSRECHIRFPNGLFITFHKDTFKVISVIGYTRGGVASVAINKYKLKKYFT